LGRSCSLDEDEETRGLGEMTRGGGVLDLSLGVGDAARILATRGAGATATGEDGWDGNAPGTICSVIRGAGSATGDSNGLGVSKTANTSSKDDSTLGAFPLLASRTGGLVKAGAGAADVPLVPKISSNSLASGTFAGAETNVGAAAGTGAVAGADTGGNPTALAELKSKLSSNASSKVKLTGVAVVEGFLPRASSNSLTPAT